MGREIRRVTPGWDHPRDKSDAYFPLCDNTFELAALRWKLGFFEWESGRHREQQEGLEFWEWQGDPPDREMYRRAWTTEPTAYQIYETVSEGTPVSPVFATLDDLRAWCRVQGHSDTAIERFIEGGWAPSAVVGHGRVAMGIDSLDLLGKRGG